jgi:hypothetical protein
MGLLTMFYGIFLFLFEYILEIPIDLSRLERF